MSESGKCHLMTCHEDGCAECEALMENFYSNCIRCNEWQRKTELWHGFEEYDELVCTMCLTNKEWKECKG